jgi:hypothetical protein
LSNSFDAKELSRNPGAAYFLRILNGLTISKLAQLIANNKLQSMAAKQQSPEKEAPQRWSQRVTKESNALDLDEGVFTWKDPKRIARSLKESAEKSKRRKSDPYRSAMSMLVFYMNRAGKNLPSERKQTLEKAKDELRNIFGKE